MGLAATANLCELGQLPRDPTNGAGPPGIPRSVLTLGRFIVIAPLRAPATPFPDQMITREDRQGEGLSGCVSNFGQEQHQYSVGNLT